MVKKGDRPGLQVLIAEKTLRKLSPLNIRIMAHLLRLCPTKGYKENDSAIREPCKISTRDLCRAIKMSQPTMLRALGELERGGFILRKYNPGKTKEIVILDFSID